MTEVPFVSVVVVSRDESDATAATVASVLAQDYPAERLEVLVVSGALADPAAVGGAPGVLRDQRVRCLENPQRRVSSGLNIGIRAARGDVICRVDEHLTIAPDYLRLGVETLRRTDADSVGGQADGLGGGWFGDAVAAALGSRFGVGPHAQYGNREPPVTGVPLGMWPRASFERVGLFDEELTGNENEELNYRLRRAGGRIVFNPAMHAWYENRQDAARLVQQYYLYGQWTVRALQKHLGLMGGRHLAPPAAVATAAALQLLGPVIPGTPFLLRALVGVYLLAVVLVALLAPGRRGVAAVGAIALAFICMHAAYGVGFLSGLVKYADRWQKRGANVPRLTPMDSP